MDNLSPEHRKKNMQNIRSQNTKPERIIMSELKKRKIYFAPYVKSIIGKPDIVFRKKKIIVFIDSDFWHGHPSRFIHPKSNIDYWENKILRNKQRDKLVNKELKKDGWQVIRIWEYNIKNNLNKCLNKILKAYSNK
ncbi:MAG: very short patch repair endonuclease [Ignavibacterium sp.]|nr:very short patch repair endonuclease [Ignavibacterium sp.]